MTIAGISIGAWTLPLAREWLRLALAMPGDGVKVDFDTTWIERHATALYPLLALGTIALVAFGILAAYRSNEVTGILKVEYKRDIITLLRKEVGGATVDQMSRELNLDLLRTATIVEEMERDGLVFKNGARRPFVFRLKGVSTGDLS